MLAEAKEQDQKSKAVHQKEEKALGLKSGEHSMGSKDGSTGQKKLKKMPGKILQDNNKKENHGVGKIIQKNIFENALKPNGGRASHGKRRNQASLGKKPLHNQTKHDLNK